MACGFGATKSSSASVLALTKTWDPSGIISIETCLSITCWRSLDGGETWKLEYPAEKGMLVNAGGMRHGTTAPNHNEAKPERLAEPIDFTHPDLALTMRFENVNRGESRLYYSYDRGHHWRGPFTMPKLDQPGIMARTDYLVNGSRDCHCFLTCSKPNGEEGRVLTARTTDGGMTWKFISFVGPEPDGFSIMPSTVRLLADHITHDNASARRPRPKETSLDRFVAVE